MRNRERDGLYLRKQTRDGASWTLRYRFGGRDRWITLGNYPDVSLAEARIEARQARVRVDKQQDPIGLRRAVQAEQGQIRAAYGVYARDQVAGPAFLALNDCANPPATNDFPKGDQFLLAVAYCNQITTVKIKLTTLDSYDKSLTSAKALLTDLKNGKDRLTAAETIKLLYEDASTLNDDVNAIRKAF